MSVIAYIRKSTDKQSFEHQEYEIKQYAQKHNLKIDRWVEESISSRKELKKRQLEKLLEELILFISDDEMISHRLYLMQNYF